jgi:TetR/AcrR family transcriptional regulator, tetracycline repressor protein
MARRSRGPGERAGLDAADVVVAAMALSAREGLKALTMRRLAAELGVTPTTLYSHFANKEALLMGIVDRLIAEVEIPDVHEVPWKDGIVSIMRKSRLMLLSHHELIPVFLAGPSVGVNALRVGEATLALLAKGGIKGPAAPEALRILLIFTFGFAAMEAPRRKRPAAQVKASRVEFPRTAAYERFLSRHPDEGAFHLGLSWLLDGISGGTARPRSAEYTTR